jgi:hypothetical protein
MVAFSIIEAWWQEPPFCELGAPWKRHPIEQALEDGSTAAAPSARPNAVAKHLLFLGDLLPAADSESAAFEHTRSLAAAGTTRSGRTAKATLLNRKRAVLSQPVVRRYL